MKRFIKFNLWVAVILFASNVKAQYQQGFEPINAGNYPTIITELRNQCWLVNELSVNAGGVSPISGNQTFVTGTAATLGNRGFISPYMAFTGNDEVSFKYKYYGTPGNFHRWFLLKLISDKGIVTTIDSVYINQSTNTVFTFQKNIVGYSGKYKLFVNYRGTGNGIQGSRTGFDDFNFSNNYFYPTGCVDTDFDGIPDHKDKDDDNDGIPDVVELCGLGATDFSCLGLTPASSDPARDADEDGIDNYLDSDFCLLNANGACVNLDFDGDGIPNHLDLDSDNDGILDAVEANGGIEPANYLSGTINSPVGPNGMPNSAEIGINSGITVFPMINTDGLGNPDYLDTDSDDDGIPDIIEAQSTNGYLPPSGIDSDGDGVDDAYDNIPGMLAVGLNPINSDNTDVPDYIDTDSDNDGRADIVEAHDTNGNNIQDGTEISFVASGDDSDNDGMDDVYDFVLGFSATNGGQTPLSFPDAQFGTSERDWRESPYGPEICNNGIDDDGDGLADCLDPDCGMPTIDSVWVNAVGPCSNMLNGSITIFSSNANTFSIDGGLNFSVDSLFTNLAVGLYNIVVSNSNGCTSSATNNPYEIVAFNCPPIAVNDTYSVNQNTVLNGTSVLDNDDATDGPALNIQTTTISGPNHGVLIINSDGTFVYTPHNNFFGIDQFQYLICDGAIPALCDTALVVINVIQVNQTPTVLNEYISTFVNVTANGNVLNNDSDPDGTLSVNTTPVLNAANGTFSIDALGNFSYIPNVNYIGNDTVIVLVCDNGGICIDDTLFITVLPNNPPIVVNEIIVINEDQNTSGNILDNDSDADGTLSVNTTPLLNALHGVFITDANGNFTYTPNQDYFGNDTVVVAVCDNFGACVNDTLFITILPVNDLPIVQNENISVIANTSYTGNILANDYDVDGTLSINPTPLFYPLNGTVTAQANGDFTYTPLAGFIGVDIMWFEVCDNDGGCVNDTVFINVTPPANQPPLILNDYYTLNENTSISSNFLTNDSDPDGTLIVNLIPFINVSNGTLLYNSNGAFSYIPNNGFFGLDTAVIIICDDGGICLNDTLFFNVLQVALPNVNNDYYTLNEDNNITANLLDNDNSNLGSLTASLIVLPQFGQITGFNNGEFTYTPNPNYNGTDYAVALVCDINNNCINDTLFFNILPVADPIIVNNESYTVVFNTPISDNILNNDIDVDGTLSVSIPQLFGPGQGTVVLNPNGNFTYTPNNGYFGADTMIVQVCSSTGPCANDTVFFNVLIANNPPVVQNDTFYIFQDQAFVGNILLNDYDAEGPVFANTTPIVSTANGTISITVNGAFTYVPYSGFLGLDYAVFSVCDMDGVCVNDTLFLIVEPMVNIPPVVVNDFYTVFQNSSINDNFLLNDYDPDGTITLFSTFPVGHPNHGTFVFTYNGDFTYTPYYNYLGNDTAIVVVCDNLGECANDTLVFSVVLPPNNSPVVVNDTITSLEDSVAQGNILLNDFDADGTLMVSPNLILPPSHGMVTFDSLGNYTYTPDADYYGNDTIIFLVCDSSNYCVNDTLFITINPVNDPIVISNEHYTINESTPLNGNIISNDSDADGTTINVDTTPIQIPNNGSIIIHPNGTFDYFPNYGFVGVDTVVVWVCDSGWPLPSSCGNDTIFITVIKVNQPPVIYNEILTTNEDLSISGTVLTNDYDPDGTTLDVNTIPVFGPQNGNIVIYANGNFTYTPNADYYGTDTIVVQICDNGIPLPAACVNDTIIIHVDPINDAPVIVNDINSIYSNQTATGNILLNDIDIENTTLTADVNNITGPAHGTFAITPTGYYTYIPNTGYYGQDTILIPVCDSGYPLPAVCVTDTLIITIAPVASVANAGADLTICENSAVSLSGNSTPVGDGLWTIVSGTAIFADSSLFNTGAWGFSLGLNQLVWSITWAGNTTSDTVNITVLAPPDLPNAGIDKTICSYTDTLQALDPINASGQWSLISGSGVIALPNAAQTTVSSLGNGNNIFVWTVSNGVCPSVSDTVVISVTPMPSVAFAGNDMEICNSTLMLNASSPIIGSGHWENITQNRTVIADSLDAQSNAYNLLIGLNRFVWVVENGVCPSSTDTLNIFTYQMPQKPFAGTDTTICQAQYTLNAQAANFGYGEWSIVSSSGIVENYYQDSTLVTALNEGENIFVWTVSNGVCEQQRDTIIIQYEICPDTVLFVPEGFSPNGDGVNDVFVISGANGKKVGVQIFNRWGSKVYESNNYQNDWGGTNDDKKELLDATYYYIITVEGEAKARTGYLTLWR